MIHEAKRHELSNLVPLVQDFVGEGLATQTVVRPNVETETIQKVLFQALVGGGVVLVDDDYQGIIMGIFVGNLWNPQDVGLHEICWFVKKEARKTTLGGRLFLSYEKKIKELRESGRIQYAVFTHRHDMDGIDFVKRGWSAEETVFTKR